MPKNWLITGGCGFIGTNFIARLLNEDSVFKIRVLDNLCVGLEDDLSQVCSFGTVDRTSIKGFDAPEMVTEVELVIGDVRDRDTCFACCEDIDTIVHLAASTGVASSLEDPKFDMETNVLGTFNLLEGARVNNVGRFIFASSGASLGEVKNPINEGMAPRPTSPYGASKLSGEGYCFAYYKSFGIKTISLRFGNVYGPRSKRKNSVVAKFFKSALTGEAIEIYGDGKQTRDFIYVDDLIEAVMLSVMSDIGGEVFQIGIHNETSVNEIAENIKAIVEKETGIETNIFHSSPSPGDVRRSCSDISKAKKMLGYEPEYDLYSGLRKTFLYFLKETKGGL